MSARLSSRSVLFGLSVTLALALTASCGGKSEEELAAEGYLADDKAEDCAAFCEALEACGQGGGLECEDACTDNELVSNAGQGVLSECIAGAGCTVESETDALLLLDCLEDGLEELPKSDAATEFCGDTLSALNECSGQPSDPATSALCEDSIALLSDPVLLDLNDCGQEADCADLQQCAGLALIGAIGLDNLQALSSLGDALGGLDLGGIDLGGLDFGGGFGPPGGEPRPDGPPAPDEPAQGGASN
jgi:hypothetical protein